MFAADLMHENLITVQPQTGLADAARIMLANHLSGLPAVTPSGQLTGIITEGNLLRRVELATASTHTNWLKLFLLPNAMANDYIKTHGRYLAEVMTPDLITVTQSTLLEDVAALMVKRHIKRLPVMEGNKLVVKLIEVEHHHTSDLEISNHIKAALAIEAWAPRTGIRIAVNDAVVNHEGILMNDAERRPVTVITENAPGVTVVHDNLIYVDPGSGMAFT